jgi:hypothetical protein
MKKLFLFVLIFTISTSHVLSFESEPQCQNPNFKPMYSFYNNNMLSTIAAGRGYTGTAALGNLSLTNLNPASLNIAYNAQAYYEYGQKGDVTLAENTNNEVGLNVFRAGVCYGAAYRINDKLQIGLTYNKVGSHEADLGVVHNYDTSGLIYETFNLYEKVAQSKVSIPVSYVLNDRIRLGLGLDVALYNAKTSQACMNDIELYENVKGKIDFVLFRPKFGVIGKVTNGLSFGMTFVPPIDKRIKEKVCWEEIKYERNSFPMEFRAGTQYSFKNLPITILADYSFVNDAINEEFIDRNDFHLGIEGTVLPFMQLRTGFYTQYDNREVDVYGDDGQLFWCDTNSYDQNFVSAGASIQWRKTHWDLAVMDSSLLSSGDLSQTYFKLGCTLELENQ